MSVHEDVTLWQKLSTEASDGNLFLDPMVAKNCRTAIDAQIDVYRSCLDGISAMANVSGIGEFECGQELAKLLGLKAVDSAGDGDLSTALREHIRVLELMGATIQVSLDRVQEQDSSNSQDYNQVG